VIEQQAKAFLKAQVRLHAVPDRRRNLWFQAGENLNYFSKENGLRN
jgi:hypothetical protein